MTLRTINGLVGNERKIDVDFYVYDNRNGTSWYSQHGGTLVCLTDTDSLFDGFDSDEVSDIDVFTWNDGIHSEEEMEIAVET